MRLAGAVLTCFVGISFAMAEPAKQATPAKKETKAKSTKSDTKAATDAIAVSYTAIPLSERISIQNDLAWTGDYNGAINGEFAERAIAAVKAFQASGRKLRAGPPRSASHSAAVPATRKQRAASSRRKKRARSSAM